MLALVVVILAVVPPPVGPTPIETPPLDSATRSGWLHRRRRVEDHVHSILAVSTLKVGTRLLWALPSATSRGGTLSSPPLGGWCSVAGSLVTG
jgi:hypothetical protein